MVPGVFGDDIVGGRKVKMASRRLRGNGGMCFVLLCLGPVVDRPQVGHALVALWGVIAVVRGRG